MQELEKILEEIDEERAGAGHLASSRDKIRI